MEHKQLDLTNGTVHYWIEKNKNDHARCIVFTHGLTGNHTMFEKQIAFFAQNYTTLTWDVPLHGLSRPYQNFSYQQTAVALKAILHQEAIEKVVLVGMSMGGYSSQMFADLYPTMVEGFVALDTTPFGMGYYSKSDLWWLKQIGPLANLFPHGLLKKSMARSVSKTNYAYFKMLEMLEPLSKAEIVEQLAIAYGEFVTENRDMNFTFPVLLLLGDSDKTGKVRQYCQAWSANTNYPLHIIEKAAHFSNGDHPEQVNTEIDQFIKGL